jgi:copper chaperone CopZ
MGVVGLIVCLTGCGSKTVSFHVDGMMCAESCAPTVQEILGRQRGVEEAVVNFETSTATCTVDAWTFDADHAIAELADQDFIATVK